MDWLLLNMECPATFVSLHYIREVQVIQFHVSQADNLIDETLHLWTNHPDYLSM